MKRIVLMMISLLLCLSMASASALSKTLMEPQSDTEYFNVQSGCLVGDTAYFMISGRDGDGLYQWKQGMDAPEMLCGNMVRSTNYGLDTDLNELAAGMADSDVDPIHAYSTLFTDGERLMSLNYLNGLVFSIKVEDGKAVYEDIVTLKDLSLFTHKEEDWSYVPSENGMAVVGNKLLTQITDWDNAGYETSRVVVADLTTGNVTAAKVEFSKALVAGKDGKALIVCRDDMNAYKEDGTIERPVIVLYDPESDTAQEAGKLDVEYLSGSIGYSAEFDAVMYLKANRIMGHSLTTGEAKQYGFVVTSNYTNIPLLMMGDTMLISGWSGITARDVNDDFSTERYLNLYSTWNDAGRRLFSERYPNVPVYDSESYYSTMEALNQAMISGDDAMDILSMTVSYSSFLTMRDKGYCADLSGDPELVAAVERMYPCFRETVTDKNGKLVAIPVNGYSWGWYVNKYAMEALGLTMDDIPTNFVDLCAFINRFNAELADENDEYTLFEYVGNIKEWLFPEVLQAYMGWCTANGKDVTFNTPEFREVMTALEGIHSENIKVSDWENDVYYMGLFSNGQQVIGNFDIQDEYYRFVPMTIVPNAEFSAGVELNVMFINPRTKNMDLALEMLKCMLEGMNDHDKHVLFMDETEPVVNPYYDDIVRGEEEYIKSLRETLESCEESEKQEVQSYLDNELAYVERYREQWKYTISPEAIERYLTELAPHMYVSKPTFLTGNADDAMSELNTLIERYNAGQITLDQFIREADNKMFMIRMENY